MGDPVEPIWTNTVSISLRWRDDEFGKPGRALYIGGLYIGNIDQLRHTERGLLWRAWLMLDDIGGSIGWYPTEQEAKDAVVDKALSLLLGDRAAQSASPAVSGEAG